MKQQKPYQECERDELTLCLVGLTNRVGVKFEAIVRVSTSDLSKLVWAFVREKRKRDGRFTALFKQYERV